MDLLDGLGLQKRWIYEVVITTYSDGRPHAAPIGVWTEDSRTLEMDIYDDSRTLRSILSDRHFAANFPADCAALGAALSPRGELDFVPAETVGAPLLSAAAATAELVLRGWTRHAGRTRVVADPVHVRLGDNLRLINRAEGLLLESLVMASRLEHRNAAVTVAALMENRRVVHKVAPGSSYDRAMDQLLRDVGESS